MRARPEPDAASADRNAVTPIGTETAGTGRARVDSVADARYHPVMDWDIETDARGLLCPLPVLKARKAMRGLSAGQVLRLVATDPAAAIDVPHFCAEAGHELLSATPEGAAVVYLLRRGG